MKFIDTSVLLPFEVCDAFNNAIKNNFMKSPLQYVFSTIDMPIKYGKLTINYSEPKGSHLPLFEKKYFDFSSKPQIHSLKTKGEIINLIGTSHFDAGFFVQRRLNNWNNSIEQSFNYKKQLLDNVGRKSDINNLQITANKLKNLLSNFDFENFINLIYEINRENDSKSLININDFNFVIMIDMDIACRIIDAFGDFNHSSFEFKESFNVEGNQFSVINAKNVSPLDLFLLGSHLYQ